MTARPWTQAESSPMSQKGRTTEFFSLPSTRLWRGGLGRGGSHSVHGEGFPKFVLCPNRRAQDKNLHRGGRRLILLSSNTPMRRGETGGTPVTPLHYL
jgi:hypothetical protein